MLSSLIVDVDQLMNVFLMNGLLPVYCTHIDINNKPVMRVVNVRTKSSTSLNPGRFDSLQVYCTLAHFSEF